MVDRAVEKQTIDRLNAEAWLTRSRDLNRSLELSLRAGEQSQRTGYRLGEARAWRTQSKCHLKNGNLDDAMLLAMRALAAFDEMGDQEGIADVLNILSELQWELGEYSEALAYTLRLLDLSRQMGHAGHEADALNGSAMIYARLQEYDNALAMLHRALPLFRDIGDRRGEIYALNNIAMLYADTDEIEKAIEFGRKGMELAFAVKLVLPLVKVLDTVGQIYSRANQKQQALYFLQQALDLSIENDLKHDTMSAMLNMARIFLDQAQIDEALPYVERALLLAEEIESLHARYSCHELLARIFERRNEPGRALVHYKTYHELTSVVFNEEASKQRRQLEVAHRTQTALKEAEIFRLRNEELQREVQKRKRVEAALVKAKEAAEVASQAKSEFLSNMSHELRTPLNGILGYTQILKHDRSLTKQQLQGLTVIRQSGEHLLTLINDILDISKIEARRLELQPAEAELSGLISAVAGMIRLRAQDKGLQFIERIHPDLPSGIYIDEKRLRQVLINLLGNAVKFTDAGSVEFRVWLAEAQPDREASARIRFAVIDTGVGIEMDSFERIFKPFEQVGNERSRNEGTGLGLAISQELVRAMGGELEVRSMLGVGSKFWFDLEVPIASNVKSHPVRADDALIGYEGPRKTILIVDRRIDNRSVIRALLAPYGFTVVEASSPHAAIKVARAMAPELVILDPMEQDEAGDMLVEKLRGLPQMAGTSIVACSARVDGNGEDQANGNRFDAVLRQPVELHALLQLIGEQLALTWRYRARTKDRPNMVGWSPWTGALPEREILEEWRGLALAGDLLALSRKAQQLRDERPEIRSFARRVVELADAYEEEAVIQLVEQSGKHTMTA